MDTVEFRTVSAGVRPGRIAVLVNQNDPEWQETGRRVIECLSSIWGGQYSIIVPTDGLKIDQVFWGLLEAFDPDYIVEYSMTGLDLKLAQPQRYQELVDAQLRQLGEHDHVGDHRQDLDEALAGAPFNGFGIAPELQKELKTRLAPFHNEDTVVLHFLSARSEISYPLTPLSVVLPHCPHPDQLVVTETNADGVPPLWVDSVLGSTYQQQTDLLHSLGVQIQHATFGPADVFRLVNWQLGRDRETAPDFVRNSPFRFSMAQLSDYRPVSERTWELSAVVVAGSTLQDFALYFDLARMRPNVCWLWPAWLDTFRAARVRADTGGEGIKSSERNAVQFAAALRNKMAGRCKGVDFVSISVNADGLARILDDLDAWSSGSRGPIKSKGRILDGIRDVLSEPRVVFNTDNYAVPTTQQVLEGKVAGFFPTPKPKGFTTLVPYEHRWITELRVDGLAYPRHPVLGAWLVKHNLFTTEEARSGRQGLCYCSPTPMYFGGDIDTILIRPELFVPTAERVFQKLALAAGVTTKISDKGFFSRDMVLKMGGLAFAAALVREPRHFAILQEFLKDGKSESAKGIYLASDRRRYLRLSDIVEILGSASEALSFIDVLVGCRILRRGAVLKCQHCRTADWFSLGELGEEFECKRCGRRQAILSQHSLGMPEPTWHYQLDEVAYQGIRNDMHAPLLALDYLRRKNPRFSYTDELEIFKPGSPRPFIEIDLCCICDGTLTIGEAKSTERIEGGGKRERRALAKYKEAAVLLGARRFVLATSLTWSPETLQNAYATFANTNVEVLPLTGGQILAS